MDMAEWRHSFMQTSLVKFLQNYKNKKVAVIGVGVSNTELIRLIAAQDITLTLRDKRDRTAIGQELCDELLQLGVTLKLGVDYLDALETENLVIRAPGVYFHLPQLTDARRAGVVVTSEMELFFDLCPCPIYAITGSDGKTTTTSIIAAMLKEQGFTVHLGGNIGRALLPIVDDISPDDRAVVELSSFQLLSMRPSPAVSVITNVTPNHLDVHGEMQEYITAKKHVFLHQNALSRTVLSADNATTLAMADEVRGQVMTFSRHTHPLCGAYCDDGQIFMGYYGQTLPLFPSADIRIPGLHNVENYLAAISAVWGEVSPHNIHKVAKEFAGVEHRIEFLREVGGVKWYNDSIATSPTRTIAGLRCFPEKIIVIAGGYDKKIPFEPLAPEVIAHVKTLILLGATADKIAHAVTSHPDYNPDTLQILRVTDLPEAVKTAAEISQDGDIVSLSPACASFDSYPNFEARGRHFKELVQCL